MNSKSWYKSKTIWANIVAFVAALAVIGGFDLGLTVDVQAEIVAAIMGGVNIVLRCLTNQGVGT